MKKLASLTLALVMMLSAAAVVPSVRADAAVSGYYTYEIESGMAVITEVSTNISGNVTIPSKLGGYSVFYVDQFAFSDCSKITSVTIPNDVYISPTAFYNCTGLKSFSVNSTNDIYAVINGVLYSKDKTILAMYPNAKGTSYAVPQGTKMIDSFAFAGTNITSISIPSTVTEIYPGAFTGCSGIKSITIPDSVTDIDDFTFAGCTSLSSIKLSSKLNAVNANVFEGCTALKSITVPDSVKSIADEAFLDCTALTSVTVGKGVSSISVTAFSECKNLQNVKVSAANSTYTDINGVLYSKDKTILYLYPTGRPAKRYNVPTTTKKINDYAFTACGSNNLTHISIPEGVKQMGAYSICGKGLEKIYIPKTATEIDSYFCNISDARNILIYGRSNSGMYAVLSENPGVYNFLEVDFERIAGKSRYDTAVQISNKGWESADTVILANGLNYADALAGVPLAYKLNAPILLTENWKDIEENVAAQIENLGASNVIILGGYKVISQQIEDTLSEKYTVERIKGATRYDTAVEISKRISENPETAVVVTGTGYADALSISPYAAKNGYPIVYSDPVEGLTEDTVNYLADAQNILIIGGYKVVRENTVAQLEGKNIDRIYGSSRYLTSYEIANRFDTEFGNDIMIATGTSFPDALAGGVLAAKFDAPILLTEDMGLIDELKTYVGNRTRDNIYVLGGEGVVPSLVAAELYH